MLCWRETCTDLAPKTIWAPYDRWGTRVVEPGVGSGYIVGLEPLEGSFNTNTLIVAGMSELGTYDPVGGDDVLGFQKREGGSSLVTEAILITHFDAFPHQAASVIANYGKDFGWTIQVYPEVRYCLNDEPLPPPLPPPPSPPPPINRLQLPNYPQHFKRMSCCDKVEEIYKYLGIAKLKRNKFPVSNAFLVPGGSGNDNCFDYYSIMQALFRMLANGLIINPKSKPLGSEWQNVNATAWASAMYEMMAESMSDGNSTQRFEVAAIMQLVQIMSTVAENGRKIECAIDAIGLEPLPVPENLPVCFTIYEGHKGFGKKEAKKINVSKLKTDNDVENVLGKMLNPSLIPITAWKFKPGQISIKEALENG